MVTVQTPSYLDGCTVTLETSNDEVVKKAKSLLLGNICIDTEIQDLVNDTLSKYSKQYNTIETYNLICDEIDYIFNKLKFEQKIYEYIIKRYPIEEHIKKIDIRYKNVFFEIKVLSCMIS